VRTYPCHGRSTAFVLPVELRSDYDLEVLMKRPVYRNTLSILAEDVDKAVRGGR